MTITNPYYENTSTAVDATSADAADVNNQFAAIQAAFDAIALVGDAAFKGQPGETPARMPVAATRANKFFGFDAAGNPEATVTWRQNWNAGGFLLRGLSSVPTLAGDAVSLGYLQAYSGSLLGLPAAVVGFLYSDGVGGLSYTSPFPTAPTASRHLMYINGVGNAWARNNANMLANPSGQFGFAGWTLSSGAFFIANREDGEYNFFSPGGAVYDIKSPVRLYGTTDTYAILASVGQTFYFSAEARQAAGTAHQLFVEWYDAGDALISTSTVAIPTSAGAFGPVAGLVTAPAATFYARVGYRSTAVGSGLLSIRRMKFERALLGGATPFSDEATQRMAWLGQAKTATFGIGANIGTYEWGDPDTTTSWRNDYHTSVSANDYDVRVEFTNGTIGTDGKGINKITCGAFKVTGAIGIHATHALAALGATETISWINGGHQSGTLDANCTITVDAPPATYPLGVYRLYLLNDATAPRTMTWAGTTITWAGGVSPPANVVNGTTVVYLDWNGTKFWGQWTQFA